MGDIFVAVVGLECNVRGFPVPSPENTVRLDVRWECQCLWCVMRVLCS